MILAKGSSFLLAHYATYDLLAFAFLALAFWAVVQWIETARWSWAVLAGLSVWAASVSKYPYAVMGFPLVALMLTRGGTSRVRDSFVLGATAALPFLATMRATFGQWIPPTLAEYRHPTFSPIVVAAVMATYIVIPILFIGWGLRHSTLGERRVRPLLMVGLAAALMWPLLHVASGQIASAFKHVWIGLLLAVPAIGYGAERAWRAAPGLRAVGVLVLIAAGAAE